MIGEVCTVGPNYVGIATLFTAVVGGIVVIMNQFRGRAIEGKVDKALEVQAGQGIVQTAIHTSVNSAAQASVDKIERLTAAADETFKAHLQDLKDELARRDDQARTDQADRDHQNGYDEPRRPKRRPPTRRR